MGIIVQKYGGTSVGNVERIRAVAERIVRTHEQGNKVVAVVSAMAGETDRLIGLAKGLSAEPPEREMDVLLTTGEQVSIALLSIAITSMGHTARSFLGHQCRILTDSNFSNARILSIEAEPLLGDLEDRQIAVIAGFQGVDDCGNLTTLGRGGSDTTAVAIAAALKADRCEIYTDVPGVFTTDPRIVPTARKLDRISFDEMLEMASTGAKVLHIRSVAFAKKYNVPLVVRSSFTDEEGTWIVQEDTGMEEVMVTGVTYDRDGAKISVFGLPDRPEAMKELLGPFAEHQINVDMIVKATSTEGFTDFSFTVSKKDLKKALAIVQEGADRLGAVGVDSDPDVAKVSIVGVGMRTHAGVATKLFDTYAKEGIRTQMVSTSEIRISTLISDKYTDVAVSALHEAFGLDRDPREKCSE
jgi:aspartate kinase